ncbi:MAG: hypothetical protein V4612_04480 [Pseudomonadota bacterium]
MKQSSQPKEQKNSFLQKLFNRFVSAITDIFSKKQGSVIITPEKNEQVDKIVEQAEEMQSLLGGFVKRTEKRKEELEQKRPKPKTAAPSLPKPKYDFPDVPTHDVKLSSTKAEAKQTTKPKPKYPAERKQDPQEVRDIRKSLETLSGQFFLDKLDEQQKERQLDTELDRNLREIRATHPEAKQLFSDRYKSRASVGSANNSTSTGRG